MQPQNLFAHPAVQEDKEHFDTLLKRTRFTLERIVSAGHASPYGSWCDQDRDEWVALLSGEAEILFEEGTVRVLLKPGDHLVIPARKRHRVERTSSDAVWLALHFDR